MYEPRTLGDALRRYWLLVAVFAILFAAAGVAVADQRQPIYTANTGLTVGQSSLSVQSIPGFATGGQAVADTLSRSITTPEVIDPAAKRLNLPAQYVADHVSATTVSRTSTFLVYGTGSSEREAVAIANAVGTSMRRYAQATQNNPKVTEQLFADYRRAAREKARASQIVTRMKRDDETDTQEFARARARLDELTLRAQTASQSYANNQQQVAAGAIVQRLAPATSATDDKSSKMQLYGVIGALAGGLIGAGIALLLAARRARRRRLQGVAVVRPVPQDQQRPRETTAA
jgi:uncharacterized protein involved in exopolysaccharide biosynthesis